MKKLLLINHGSTFGGSGIAFLKIIESLDLDQYITTVYCAADIPAIADELDKYNLSVIRGHRSPVTYTHFSGGSQSVFSPYYILNLLQINKDKKKIEEVIDRLEPDIVMVNSMTLYWVGEIARKKSVKSVICFHRETYAHGTFGLRTYLLKKSLDKYFDRIAFISRYDMERTKLKHAQGVVIPDCVDTSKHNFGETNEIRNKLGLDSGKFYVLFLGGISKLKGVDVFLEAIDQCNCVDVRGIMLGTSSFAENLPFSKLQKTGLRDYVRQALGFNDICVARNAYLRMVHKERAIFLPISKNVEQWYAASDIVVFPSTRPHQAMPIYEAGAARRLIIISNYPNTKEYLDNGVNGLTFKARDSRALAEKIDWALTHKYNEEYRKMIEENYIRTEKFHNMKNYASQVRRFFDNTYDAKN